MDAIRIDYFQDDGSCATNCTFFKWTRNFSHPECIIGCGVIDGEVLKAGPACPATKDGSGKYRLVRVMREFQHPNMINFECRICKSNIDAPVVLVPIPGTEHDGIVEAEQVHSECFKLIIKMHGQQVYITPWDHE